MFYKSKANGYLVKVNLCFLAGNKNRHLEKCIYSEIDMKADYISCSILKVIQIIFASHQIFGFITLRRKVNII